MYLAHCATLSKIKVHLRCPSLFGLAIENILYTLNTNMADHSVGARDKYDSEASEALVLCFDNPSPEKSCFVDGLVCFISLCLL